MRRAARNARRVLEPSARGTLLDFVLKRLPSSAAPEFDAGFIKKKYATDSITVFAYLFNYPNLQKLNSFIFIEKIIRKKLKLTAFKTSQLGFCAA